MKSNIEQLIKKALKELGYESENIQVDYPKNERFGDYTTNVAMILGRELKKNPLEIAEEIKDRISKSKNEDLEKIEVVKPGYVNFYLSNNYLQNKIQEINELKGKFGNSEIGKAMKVNNEFISANPTGPLTIGNGRGGFLGDAISRILKKNGFEVTNEYYINNAGEQVLKLGHSVLGDEEAVYSGEYIDEIRNQIPQSDDVGKIGEEATRKIMDNIIKPTIEEKMRISFDVWFSEKELHEKKYVDKAIDYLKGKNLTYEKEGALWLKTTRFGDDKDRVLVKKDGHKTYFASDCGYILNKKKRDFKSLIEIWGADHHGYVSRFKAAAEALGFERNSVNLIIVQLVRLVKDGKEVRMSKRAGNVVYVDELISEVGHDVARFFFLMYSPDTHMNFDLGLAKERSEKNPVYYVQYAHARICSILSKAEGDNFKINSQADLGLLQHEKELSLARELNKFPELVLEITKSYEVHKLPYYAVKLADKFHSFYNEVLVLDEKNPELTLARLNLVNSVRMVLKEVLRLMGVSAPERM